MCKVCGADFYVEPYRLRSTIQPTYCSLRCFGKARASKANAYTVRRRTFNLAAKGERHCRVCGSAEHVHAHHAIPVAIGTPESELDLRNLLPLCWHCHRYWHAGYPISRDVFTAEEWEYLSALTLEGREAAAYLDKHYPAGPVRDFATHCLRGHEYEPDNLWRDARGRPHCRVCSRAEWYARTGRADEAEAVRLFGVGR